MRHRVYRLAAAGAGVLAAAAAGPRAAAAAVYYTPSQAEEKLLPPHDDVRIVHLAPSDEQKRWLEARLGYAPPRDRYMWRVAERGGKPVGYMLIDNEIGKHDPITFAVALDARGAVLNVAVCVYRESRGDEITRASFMKQFLGMRYGDEIRLDREVMHVSGATLSSRSAVVVVNRALALWELAFNMPESGAPAAAE